MKLIEGGVCAAKGFTANGIHCGIRKNKDKKDLILGLGIDFDYAYGEAGDECLEKTGILFENDFVDTLKAFHEDKNTDIIVMIGQMGGTFEELGARYYQSLNILHPYHL